MLHRNHTFRIKSKPNSSELIPGGHAVSVCVLQGFLLPLLEASIISHKPFLMLQTELTHAVSSPQDCAECAYCILGADIPGVNCKAAAASVSCKSRAFTSSLDSGKVHQVATAMTGKVGLACPTCRLHLRNKPTPV